MISAWWLFLIVPVSCYLGFGLCALMVASKEENVVAATATNLADAMVAETIADTCETYLTRYWRIPEEVSP